jgi:predicted RNase H-like nuclease (RuvC/YqgF family)
MDDRRTQQGHSRSDNVSVRTQTMARLQSFSQNSQQQSARRRHLEDLRAHNTQLKALLAQKDDRVCELRRRLQQRQMQRENSCKTQGARA